MAWMLGLTTAIAIANQDRDGDLDLRIPRLLRCHFALGGNEVFAVRAQ